MFRGLTCLLVSGVISLAACGDDGTSPEDQLTVEEVEFVANLIDSSSSDALDDFFDSSGGDPAGAPALIHAPVVWTRTFERSRPCHDGGTLTVTGTGESAWDEAAVTYDVDGGGRKNRTDCAYTRNDVVITLNGSADWTHDRHYLNYAPTGTWISTFVGSYDWTKSTGESGSCTYDLTRTVDTATNTRTLTGTSCGNVIDRTDTWRG